MEKKNLKWYEAPEMELVDVKLQGMLCGSPVDPDDPFGGMIEETPGGDE